MACRLIECFIETAHQYRFQRFFEHCPLQCEKKCLETVHPQAGERVDDHEDDSGNDGHEGHDHDAHDHGHQYRDDHGHDHDDEGREGHDGHDHRRLAANCANGEEKTVSVVLINDASRYAEYGESVEDDAAAIYSHVKDIYGGGNGLPGIYDGSAFDCKINMQIVGQLTFRRNPGALSYKGPSDGCNECGSSPENADFCFAGEVSAYCLLESLTFYLGTQ